MKDRCPYCDATLPPASYDNEESRCISCEHDVIAMALPADENGDPNVVWCETD